MSKKVSAFGSNYHKYLEKERENIKKIKEYIKGIERDSIRSLIMNASS